MMTNRSKHTPDHQDQHRDMLQNLELKAQESFDKTVLTLSGGALGVSFAFVSDIIGTASIRWPLLLLGAWCSWGFSVTAVLSSFFFSNLALRHAINQLDSGRTVYQHLGGRYDYVTAFMNAAGGLLFLIGVVAMGVFAMHNMMR